ncbi:hypothetical protein H696_05613 [Fonticula alba]|uniref:Programmed cell death protein 2 C-terminal domain-containing protein n=1 Tax=Fonticula alba TaxID=691883 RepID=A0A058Z0U7_FONAL|nr:hypothetical protein H696_05613 [Fonticula alba]KCV67884.1 hypothetical protein H696_05613 [Fonticula alba]|eukprot:XP_009497704.1 hypothetical protein H696_05613 [Fonticula alba]
MPACCVSSDLTTPAAASPIPSHLLGPAGFLALPSYARFPDRRSPIPLWASNLERPLTADLPAGAFVQPGPRVPPCDRCGGARTFEFQVMPQLLAFMEVDHTRVDSIDWGTLLVYSCEGSCELGAPSSSSSGPGASDGPKGSRYAREVVCRQLFTSDGLANDLTVSGARFPRAAAASSSATITELD